MPTREAILPRLWIRSMSSAVSASSNVSGYFRIIRWTMSICSSVAVTAAWPWSSTGTYTDQNCPPTPPSFSRGMSVMIDGCGLADVERVEIARGIVLAQRPRIVVVAVDEQRRLVQRAGAREEIGLG